jgi:hypothetical protein
MPAAQALRPALRHVPVAVYTIGLFYYRKAEPYKTVQVKADNKQAALEEGRKLLNPSTVESVRCISTAPNPSHIAYQEELRIGYSAFDATTAAKLNAH